MAQILVIDDDNALRGLIAQILEDSGYTVMTAEDGNAGLKLMHRHPAELVVTDIIMPGKEGLETIQDLRALYPKVRIIAMSGGSEILNARQLTEMATGIGADYALVKPFPPSTLLAHVAKLLQKA